MDLAALIILILAMINQLHKRHDTSQIIVNNGAMTRWLTAGPPHHLAWSVHSTAVVCH
jgi:hypothetical protein